MNITVDPDITGDELRQRLYAGEPGHPDPPAVTAEFRGLHPRGAHRAVRAARPRTRPRAHRTAGDGEDPGCVEAAVHPRGNVEEAGPGGHRGGGVPGRGDSLRPAQAADLVPGRAPHHRRGLRLPVAPRRLVQRARPAGQLVAPHLPGAGGQRYELRPGQLRPGGAQQLGCLRLLREQRPPVLPRRLRSPRKARPGQVRWTTGPIRSWSCCPRPARSCCSPAPSCTPRSRTRPAGPGSASTSGPSMSPT